MAIVRPYGDPNAHGPLNKTICFRRYRNQVIMQTFPDPHDPRSPAQLLQREKLVQANKAYSLTKGASRFFYRKRAAQRRKTGKSLFMWAYLNSRLPSVNFPILAKSIESMIIYDPVGDQPNTIQYSISNLGGYPALEVWNPLDSIWDGSVPSNVGPDATIIGSMEIIAGKFDNAIRQAADDSSLTFPDAVMNWEQGFYAFWMQTDFDVASGIPQAMDELVFAMTYGDSTGLMSFNFGLTPGNRILGLRTVYQTLLLDGITAASWSAGQWVHIAYAWDRYATNGWTSAVFINGVLAKSGTNAWINIIPVTRTFNIPGPINYAPAVWGRVAIDDLLINTNIDDLFEVLQDRNSPGAQSVRTYAVVLDNSNEFFKISEVTNPVLQIITISTAAGFSAEIPFRYLISVEWINQDDEIVNSVIRLPALSIPALTTIDLYLSRDWSVYWDEGLTRLACTNWV